MGAYRHQLESATPLQAGKPPVRRVRRVRKVRVALLLALLSALLPGSGHLVLGRRIGYVILGILLLLIGAGCLVTFRVPRNELLEYVLSSQALLYLVGAFLLVGVLWVLVIVSTYVLAVPRRSALGRRLVGGILVAVLCAATVTPFGYAAYTANTQRILLNTVFPAASSPGGQSATGAEIRAIRKPRINLLLVGSDAGPGRVGTRTDTIMVASIDTKTGQATLFSLSRNLMLARFPAGSKLAKRFPKGFTDPHSPDSPEYLLNALYSYGNEHPDLVPPGPSRIPGLNLLAASVSTMLGLQLDYYIQVNMSGFASIIDALGGLDVNVGPRPVPIGGIGVHGEPVKPFGYIPAGLQRLNGEQALWYARSRTNTDDYTRMGRQRCLVKYIVDQKSPAKILSNFRAVTNATSSNIITNIPQDVLPALVQLAMKVKNQPLESISFDPTLPILNKRNRSFDTARPDFRYMRQVVQNAISPPRAPVSSQGKTTITRSTGGTDGDAATGEAVSVTAPRAAPATSLDAACYKSQE
ncbi:MAG: LCP family protein [Pseudonocardiaceae bacterium]